MHLIKRLFGDFKTFLGELLFNDLKVLSKEAGIYGNKGVYDTKITAEINLAAIRSRMEEKKQDFNAFDSEIHDKAINWLNGTIDIMELIGEGSSFFIRATGQGVLMISEKKDQYEGEAYFDFLSNTYAASMNARILHAFKIISSEEFIRYTSAHKPQIIYKKRYARRT